MVMMAAVVARFDSRLTHEFHLEAPVPPARLRVLAIDDEPDFGPLLTRHLRPLADVVFVGAIVEAAPLLTDGGFDVLLCDLNMPCGGAPAVEALVARTRPELVERIVYVTGGAFTEACESFLARAPGRVLHKPFTTTALRAALERAVAGLARRAHVTG